MSLKDRILSSDRLPSLPSVATGLLDLSRDPDASLQSIAALLKTDPALSAKILKAANSAYYSFRSEVASIDRAVPLLGRTTVMSLSLSFVLLDFKKAWSGMSPLYDDYWLRSIVQAVVADELTKTFGGGDDGRAFQAGLLADIGRLAMMREMAEDYAKVVTGPDADLLRLHDLELRAFGFHHVDIGVELLKRWNINDNLIEAVRREFDPTAALTSDTVFGTHPLAFTSAVSSAVSEYLCGPAKGASRERFRELLMEGLDLSSKETEALIPVFRTAVETASSVFEFDADSIDDSASLMAEANEQLAQLVLFQASMTEQAVQKQQKLESEKEQLIKQTVRDELTGLANRRHLTDTLRKEVSRAGRYSRTVGVLFLDIDRFKNLNDTYGHAFGDEALVAVAHCLEQTLRDSDLAARYGGEEFVAVLVEPTEDGVHKTAERVRRRIEALELTCNGTPVPVTVSIGGTVVIPGREGDELVQTLLKTADAAMYESKRNGRNRVTIRSLLGDRTRDLLSSALDRRFSHWLIEEGLLDRDSVRDALADAHLEPRTFEAVAEELGYLDSVQIDDLRSRPGTGDGWIGHCGLEQGLLNEAELISILVLTQEDPREFARHLVQDGYIDEAQARKSLSQYLQTLFPASQRSTTSA